MNMKTEISNIIYEKIKLNNIIDENAALSSYGIDSLILISIVIEIENLYNITFPPEKLTIDNLSTLDLLCKLTYSLLN